MKWLYKENITTLCNTKEQINELQEHFSDKRKPGELKVVHVNEALKMVRNAKEKASKDGDTKPTKEEVSKWTRQQCDSFLKKSEKSVPEETGVDAGRKAVLEALKEG